MTVLDRGRYSQSSRHRSKKEIDAEALQVLRMKVLGWSDVRIGEELGMTRQTVAKRFSYAVATHGQPSVKEFRELAAQRYALLIEKALENVTEANKYEAIKVVADINAKFVRLVGAEAPVAVDVEVHHVTEQEKELREMLAQAQRDEKARETVIVEGETVDV